LKSGIDFSLANAVAARYDTVTIRVSLCYACSGIVSDDPDKTRLIGYSRSGGLYFFNQCFQPRSARFDKARNEMEKDFRQGGFGIHFQPLVEIKFSLGTKPISALLAVGRTVLSRTGKFL
jgi:hypothetical protein